MYSIPICILMRTTKPQLFKTQARAQILLSRPSALNHQVFESRGWVQKGIFPVNTKKFIYHYAQNEINPFYQVGPTNSSIITCETQYLNSKYGVPIGDSENKNYSERTP